MFGIIYNPTFDLALHPLFDFPIYSRFIDILTDVVFNSMRDVKDEMNCVHQQIVNVYILITLI